MNDSMVHSSNIKVVLNQQAYVLFYLRCVDVCVCCAVPFFYLTFASVVF